MNNSILIDNIDKIHTTEMGINRIKRNINIDLEDVISWCKDKIINSSNISRRGKNWYVIKDNYILTINAYSYTVITVHIIKESEKIRYGK